MTAEQFSRIEPSVATILPPADGAAAPKAESPTLQSARLQPLRRFLGNRKALFGAAVLLIFVGLAVAAPWVARYDPSAFVDRPHQPPSRAHWLGTEGQGKDVWAQTVWGARITLGIGFTVGILATVIGAVVGMAAGYFRGRIDDALSLTMNVFLIIPSLPLLVTLAAFLPSGTIYFVLVLTVTGWAWPARVLRSQTLSLREKDFVSAAVVSGEGSARIIFREIMPNMISIVLAGMLGSTVYAIGAEAGLEFLGLGDISAITWGTNLYWAGNNAGLLTGAWWTFVPAGACIALVAFALVMMNYAMDEIMNPRLRAQKEAGHAIKRRAVRATRPAPVLNRAG